MQAASAAKNPVTLILGGARSGKSRYAQTLAARAERVVFVATATAVDDEMGAKIERHRRDRVQDRLARWKVVEEPLALASTIARYGPTADLILIDCVTLYVASLLSLDDEAEDVNLSQFYAQISAPPCSVVLVSNEVGSGVVPEYASGRRYRDLLGEINQRTAAMATDVLLMVAGLPLTLKRNGVPA